MIKKIPEIDNVIVQKTIMYDEERHHCTLHKNRDILEKYRGLL